MSGGYRRERVIFPHHGPGSPRLNTPAVLNATLGTHFKLIAGYAGSSEQVLAVENGEGRTGNVASWIRERSPGSIVASLRSSSTSWGVKLRTHPHLKGVPAAEKLAKNDEDLAILRSDKRSFGDPALVLCCSWRTG